MRWIKIQNKTVFQCNDLFPMYFTNKFKTFEKMKMLIPIVMLTRTNQLEMVMLLVRTCASKSSFC